MDDPKIGAALKMQRMGVNLEGTRYAERYPGRKEAFQQAKQQ